MKIISVFLYGAYNLIFCIYKHVQLVLIILLVRLVAFLYSYAITGNVGLKGKESWSDSLCGCQKPRYPPSNLLHKVCNRTVYSTWVYF
jgi:hypothetical protein